MYLLCFPNLLEFMSSSDDLSCADCVVVAEAVGNEGTAPDEVIVLVEEEAGPRELPRTGCAIGKPPSSGISPGAALLSTAKNSFPAKLPPHALGVVAGLFRADAGLAKHGEINVAVITARLGQVPRTAVDLLLLLRDVDDSGADAAVLKPGIDKATAHEILSAEGISALL